MRLLVRALLLVAGLWLAAAAHAQEAVQVRGGNHVGHGRVVFDWSQPVQYRAFVRNNALHLEFARRASFQTSGLFPALNDYIGLGAPGPHGYRITFPMKRAFGVKHFTYGPKVVIDLTDPANAAGLDPSDDDSDSGQGDGTGGGTAAVAARQDAPRQAVQQPDATAPVGEDGGAAQADAPEAESLPKVRVRVGEHPGYDRLVFDWPEPVSYRIDHDRAGGETVLAFDRPALMDIGAYRGRTLDRVTGLRPSLQQAGAKVALTTPEGARVRHFTLDKRVVVDVFAPGREPPDDGPGVLASREATGSTRPETDKASNKPATTADAGKDTTTASEGSAARNEEGPASPSAEAASAAPGNAEADGQPAAGTSAADAPDKPEEAEGDGAEGDPDAIGAPTPLVPRDENTRRDAPESAPAPAVARDDDGGAFAQDAAAGTTDAADGGSEDGLRFTPEQVAQGIAPKPGEIPPPVSHTEVPLPWATATAAVYRRGGALWLVAEGTAPDGFPTRLERSSPGIEAAAIVDNETATVVRIEAAPGLDARLDRQEGPWVLSLAPQAALPRRPLRVNVADGRVMLPAAEPGPVVSLRDPGSGGSLRVVPLAAPGRGLALARRFQEFSLLPTSLGIVVAPWAEHVRIETTDAGVVVHGGDRPLAVSKTERASTDPGRIADLDGRRLLDLPAWRHAGEPYTKVRQRLQKAVANAPPAERHLRRLDLARLFFAHGLATETLGALALYAEEKPRRGLDPQVRLMKGAAHLLDGEWRQAGETLAHPALDGVGEALPWRGAHAMLTDAHQAGLQAFHAGERFLDTYPDTVRKRMHIWAAESHLRLGEVEAGGRELEKARRLHPNQGERAEIAFLEARRLLLDGEAEAAGGLWQQVAKSDHPPSGARARFVMIERDLAAGRIGRDAAIARLERLRFAWRGDEFEAILLDRLATLYLAGDEYRRGLSALRQAASHLPDTRRAKRATNRMRDVFERLFLEGEADKLPSLKALALYESFRELTPAGAKGDRMIARLADRLVRVDLLDRAANLLEGQVRHRLSGAEKARTGARLTSIHLLDEAPEKALDALLISEVDGTSADLMLRRQHLKARALAEAGRGGEALALLAADTTEEGLRIKAKIHSEQGAWDKAAEAFLKLLPPPPAQGEDLSEAAADRVMRAVVALTLAGRQDRLRRINARYGAAMDRSGQADSFRLLAAQPEAGEATIQSQLAQVTQAQSFMTDYLRSLQQQAKLADGER